jgi:hypothetical protein
MIQIGPAGCFAGPQQPPPPADCFREGDVWQSPWGQRWRVVRVTGYVATLRSQDTGRSTKRPWDAVGSYSSTMWIRVSCESKS